MYLGKASSDEDLRMLSTHARAAGAFSLSMRRLLIYLSDRHQASVGTTAGRLPTASASMVVPRPGASPSWAESRLTG